MIASHRWLPEGVGGVAPVHRNFLLPARHNLSTSGRTGTRGAQGCHCLGDAARGKKLGGKGQGPGPMAALLPVLPEPWLGCPT